MIYRFEDYELDTDLYELRLMGKALRVEPKVFDLLTYLVQHHGHVCSKERLLDQLWADQFVSDWALAYSIKSARHVVGDDGPVKRVIRTIRGRGYRFVAPVETRAGHAHTPSPHHDTAPATPGTETRCASPGPSDRTHPALGAEQEEIVAQHLSASGQWREAIPHWRAAGQQALAHGAPIAAATHIMKQIEAVAHVLDISTRTQPELTFQTTLSAALATLPALSPQDKEGLYVRARELCPQWGDTSQGLQVLQGLWSFYLLQAAFATARELGEACLQLAHRTPCPALAFRAHHVMGVTLFRQGELTGARDHLEGALSRYDGNEHGIDRSACDLGVMCLAHLGQTLWLLGQPEQALERMHAARTLAQELAHPLSQICALVWAAELHGHCREPQAAQTFAETAIALATEHGMPHWTAHGMVLAGWALCESGREAAGMARLRQGISAYPTVGAGQERPRLLAIWAHMLAKHGERHESLTALDEAFTWTQRAQGSHGLEAELYRLKGECLRRQTPARPALDEVESCFQQARAVARRQQAKALELRAALSLGRLWQQQGKRDEARRLLTACRDEFTEGFHTGDFKALQALLETLS